MGRDATDTRFLVALWVFATLKAIGSVASSLGCVRSAAVPWLCGGVSVNYHMLSDFRSRGGRVGRVAHADRRRLVGSRIGENGPGLAGRDQGACRRGNGSFRRRGRLEECLEEAREQVETLKQLAEEDGAELTQRQRAARERAPVSDRSESNRRCASARSCRGSAKPRRSRAAAVDEARASTTNPEAQEHEAPDGGCRPGYTFRSERHRKRRDRRCGGGQSRE